MAANVYECLFLLDPTKVSGDVPGAAKQLHAVLERHGAEILASRLWSEHKLAYQVSHHKKGVYYLIYFRSEGKNLKPIEQDLTLNEMVLRQLTLRIHIKLVDLMLAVARDEHALALHTATDPDGDSGTDGPPGGGDDHGRGPRGGRGARRPAETSDK
jgi:small subunit ribosomal protein S6